MSDVPILKHFDLTGKVALVTGAGSGIGQGIAVGLAEAGASIAAVYHSEITETERQVTELGREFQAIKADLSKMESIEPVINEILGRFGRIDILVNNAGAIFRQEAATYPESEWDNVVNINLKVLFFFTQAVANHMIKNGIQGNIINIASLMAFQGGVFVPAYTASKSAIKGLTMSLANEWAKYGINVNALAPGWIKTKMTSAVQNNEARNKEIVARIPAGRWGDPEDFKGPAVFLASKASSYINGSTIAVDGGFLGR
jgi:2-dehydro-3-deoxy-D-gluconate 5-dehydrogenase